MEENTDLLSINYVSKLLGVTKFTLRNWDNTGVLKAIRIGNRGDRRYKKSDVEKFIFNKENLDKNIDMKKFFEYLDKNEFWFQEAPGLIFTT